MKKSYICIAGISLYLISTVALAQSFTLCRGERYQSCGSYDVYVGCAPGLAEKRAAKLCQDLGSSGTPKLVFLRDRSGDHCGYSYYQIVCQ